MESAMTSRLTREAFMPSVAMDTPSLTVMVPNSKGVPLAERMPSFTRAVSGPRWTLQGVTSLARFATPMKGLDSAVSSRPAARSMEREPARVGPAVIAWLLCFMLSLRV